MSLPAAHLPLRTDGETYALDQSEWALLGRAAPNRICPERSAHTSPLGIDEWMDSFEGDPQLDAVLSLHPDEERLLEAFAHLRVRGADLWTAARLAALLPRRMSPGYPPPPPGYKLSAWVVPLLEAADAEGLAEARMTEWIAAPFTTIEAIRMLAGGAPAAWVRAAGRGGAR